MANLQLITHDGELVAVVLAGYAFIDPSLPKPDLRHAQAMCLYALELAEEGRQEAYTDADAEAYAQAALGRR